MRIEHSFLQPCPWRRDGKNGLPFLFTGSSIRREVAEYSRLPLASLSLLEKINHGEAEERTKNKLGGNGVVTSSKREDSSPPLPVGIATDKAAAVYKYFWKQLKGGSTDIPSSVVCVDSIWGVDDTPDNPWDCGSTQLLHKPNGKLSIDGIIESFMIGANEGSHL